MRVLPNTVKVEITERTPIAFLREGSDMALVDAHGVILDRPMKGNFHFPVVSGIRPGHAARRSRSSACSFSRASRSK